MAYGRVAGLVMVVIGVLAKRVGDSWGLNTEIVVLHEELTE